MEVLRFLQTHKYGDGLNVKEWDRIYRRAKAYRWMANGVFSMLLEGAMLVVPRTAERETIVIDTHREMGHFGVQRVLHRLRKNYWWRGMKDAVVKVIKACLPCARVRLSGVGQRAGAVTCTRARLQVGSGLHWAPHQTIYRHLLSNGMH